MIKDKNYYKEKAERIITCAHLLSKKFKSQKTEQQHILDGLKNAYREWRMNEEYFEWVTDPDLIDYAIYEIKASKIKYSYFLKKAKEMANK
ncbi:MAG: YaaL family protein [Tissierellales bacterium]